MKDKKTRKNIDNYIMFAIIVILLCIIIGITVFRMSRTTVESLSSAEEYPVFTNNEPVYEYYKENFLNEEQKQIYNNFKEATLQFKTEFYIGMIDITKEEVSNIYEFFLQDHPEIFWVHSFSMGLNNFNQDYVAKLSKIEIDYYFTKEETIKKLEKMKLTYEPVIEEASKLSTDREKVKYVRDKIMEIGTPNLVRGPEAKDYYSMNSIFEYGKTMCAGYACGFKFIMDRVGVPAICVMYSTGKSEESHIWNMVKLDNTWYNMDISFDDELDELYNKKGDKYYLVEDNDIFYQDHQINEYLPNLK